MIHTDRSEKSLKGVDGLNQTPPGVDARDLFLRLDRLKPLAVEPVLKPEDETPVPSSTKQAEPKLDEGLGISVPGADHATHQPGPLEPTLDVSDGDVGTATTDPDLATTLPDEMPLTAPEQLFMLLNFIEEHFRDTTEELNRLEADGYMAFRLLWAICAPGSVVEVKDDATEHPMGSRVESWSYGVEYVSKYQS
jgi:hypothetical protein